MTKKIPNKQAALNLVEKAIAQVSHGRTASDTTDAKFYLGGALYTLEVLENRIKAEWPND